MYQSACNAFPIYVTRYITGCNAYNLICLIQFFTRILR
nr:MAG TPA: hypothetical protein [Caudoviricetes sp.]DAX74346.1 MAG TPA: hypothetical protein [Caudoviricetes sp.]